MALSLTTAEAKRQQPSFGSSGAIIALGLDRNHVVDHERGARVLLHVAVLLALRETAVATDLDRVLLCVVAERHRHDVRLATRVGRSDTPEALAP